MQRLKQIVPICFVIFLFSIPTFATDPDISVNDTGTGMCVYDVLDTYSGTAGFKANWEANNIKLRWYNGNTLITPGNDSANDCDYNGGLNVPSTPPTRTGYTFSGWTVRPGYDFKTLNYNPGGVHSWAKFVNANNEEVCYYDGSNSEAIVDCDSDNEFKELRSQEWKVSFSYGTVYGMAKSSNQSGGGSTNSYYSTFDEISDTPGNRCWCKATGFKPTNSNVIYRPSEAMPWVYMYGTISSEVCAAFGSKSIKTIMNYRRALYNKKGM